MTRNGAATHRMLILACSRRKRPGENLLPAIERYDGPAFRILRRFLRKRPSETPHILILSAEHGLIAHDLPIATYDRKMTPARARELRPSVLADLHRIASTRSIQETLIVAGRHYLMALQAGDALLVPGLNARACPGPLGKKLAQLHDWLHGAPPALRYNSGASARGSGARIRGVEVSLTAEQVIDIARQALTEGRGNPGRYESWCVPIDEHCVAPKWLVSQLTGMPLASFHSDDARRVLQQLGVEARRM